MVNLCGQILLHYQPDFVTGTAALALWVYIFSETQQNELLKVLWFEQYLLIAIAIPTASSWRSGWVLK